MTLQKLAALIAKREGKRSQTKIHDVKEVLSVFCDIIAEEQIKEELTFSIYKTQYGEPLDQTTANMLFFKMIQKRTEKLSKKSKAKK